MTTARMPAEEARKRIAALGQLAANLNQPHGAAEREIK